MIFQQQLFLIMIDKDFEIVKDMKIINPLIKSSTRFVHEAPYPLGSE